MTVVPSVDDASIALMIGQEVTDEKTYTELYQHPDWPGEGSGVTVAIGYDIGQTGAARLHADWSGYLDDATITRLSAACGVQGEAAKALLPGLADISIPYSTAYAAFTQRKLPQVIEETVAAFPGSDKLPPSCLGALVSLVYNRGALIDNSDRRREMRQIRTCIQTGHLYLIPDLFRSQERIWVGTSIYNDMKERRSAEADLFQAGLTAPVNPAFIPVAQPSPAPAEPQDVAINTDH